MPITLITGFPRNGKSYETVRMMAEDFPDRKKYAINFTDLDYKMLDVEEMRIEDWQSADNGAVIFVDEVWQFFEAKGPHNKRADYIKQLALHGHKGLDLYLVTQGPFQVDIFVRQLVEWHFHIVRPFGMPYYNIRKFRGIDKDPEAGDARKRAFEIKRKNRFKEKIWRYYKSSDAHTVKARIPFKLFGAVIVLIAFVYFAVKTVLLFMNFGEPKEEEAIIETVAAETADVSTRSGIGSLFDVSDTLLKATGQNRERLMVGTPEYDSRIQNLLANYYIQEKELIFGAPWTASKWAEVMKPVTFPKPRCIHMPEKDRCVCHSQQGTTMQVEKSICVNLANNGWFDPTLDDQDIFKTQQQEQVSKAEQYGFQEALKLRSTIHKGVTTMERIPPTKSAPTPANVRLREAVQSNAGRRRN